MKNILFILVGALALFAHAEDEAPTRTDMFAASFKTEVDTAYVYNGRIYNDRPIGTLTGVSALDDVTLDHKADVILALEFRP